MFNLKVFTGEDLIFKKQSLWKVECKQMMLFKELLETVGLLELWASLQHEMSCWWVSLRSQQQKTLKLMKLLQDNCQKEFTHRSSTSISETTFGYSNSLRTSNGDMYWSTQNFQCIYQTNPLFLEDAPIQMNSGFLWLKKHMQNCMVAMKL